MTLEETASTIIVLMRHAESTFNIEGKLQGHSFEAVLTAKGRQQAILRSSFKKGISSFR